MSNNSRDSPELKALKRRIQIMGLSALVFAGSYAGLSAYKNQKFDELARDFPVYVTQFEDEYGKFREKPKLVFGRLRSAEGGRVGGRSLDGKLYDDSTIFINDDLTSFTHYLLFESAQGAGYHRIILKHELAHLVENQIIKNIYSQMDSSDKWLYINQGVIVAPKERKKQAIAICEGLAEYISLQQSGREIPSIFYEKHYNFVKPVIDKFGLKGGIKKMLFSPPTETELDNPHNYYKSIGI